MIRLYTIGFTQKSAEEFFGLLQDAGVRQIIDVRLNNASQLAGFTKKRDLPYFLHRLAGIGYRHEPMLAPEKVMLERYRKGLMSWRDYERYYMGLLEVRRVDRRLLQEEIDQSCFLCSEAMPRKCHRSLATHFLASKWGRIETHHL